MEVKALRKLSSNMAKIAELVEGKYVKLKFFGDSDPLTAQEPLTYFSGNIVCDYTECGAYVASKQRTKSRLVVLDDLARFFGEIYGEAFVKVEAENNGIANFFKKENIKTLADLTAHFRRLLER